MEYVCAKEPISCDDITSNNVSKSTVEIFGNDSNKSKMDSGEN
jgi:hypothetical protein